MLFINASDKRFAEAASKRRGAFESQYPESQNLSEIMQTKI